MISEQEWTKADHKDAKIFTLTTSLYRLEKKSSVLATVQGGGGNITQTRTNSYGRDPNMSYIEGINNLEYWRVKKSRENIIRYGQNWWWSPKHKTEGKSNGVYINHKEKIMMNGIKKNRGRDNPKKGHVPAYKGL